jgi:hypothetical protein
MTQADSVSALGTSLDWQESLGFALVPEPQSGCDVCSALMEQWKTASKAGSPEYDPSFASDLAVEIRRHPHGEENR